MRKESRSSGNSGQLMLLLLPNAPTSQAALLREKTQRQESMVDKDTRSMIKTGIKGVWLVGWYAGMLVRATKDEKRVKRIKRVREVHRERGNCSCSASFHSFYGRAS